MFNGLTVELVKEAVKIVRPTIEAFLQSERTEGRPNLHLVVLEPEGSGEILYQVSFGNSRKTWKYDFDNYARRKAWQCQRTGLVGRNVLRDAPWLVQEGDTRYVGGVVENGFWGAGPGVFEPFYSRNSFLVLSAIQGLCRDEIAKIDDDNDPDYFGSKD